LSRGGAGGVECVVVTSRGTPVTREGGLFGCRSLNSLVVAIARVVVCG